jgi:predicted anti-sigma-YlaC factor YlaD
MSVDLACNELVEIVTNYLDGALDEHDRSRFEEHLLVCGGCVNYLDQMRTTIEVTGRLAEQDIAPDAMAELVHAFRGWHAASPG